MDACPALDRLYGAVAGLIDPVKEMHDDAIMSAPACTSSWERADRPQGKSRC